MPGTEVARRVDSNVVIEDANIGFLNFSGLEGMYNRAGDRNFCVFLDPDLAAALDADGWNIKQLKVREPGDEPQSYIQVAVGFKGRPPRIVLITSKGKRELTQDEVEILDWIDIGNADLIMRPYNWLVNGKSGVKAYLKSIFVTMDESILDMKYADVPELNASSAEEILTGSQLAIESGQDASDDDDEEVFEAEIVDE